MSRILLFMLLGLCSALVCASDHQSPATPPSAESAASNFDPALAQSLGADEYGMRGYVLVILKTGPTPMPKGAERDAMFKGHFANMNRLVAEGKLVLAGPLDGKDGWRGMFVLSVPDIEAAKAAVDADPTVKHGEFVAEYHTYYGRAALMQLPELHKRVAKKEI